MRDPRQAQFAAGSAQLPAIGHYKGAAGGFMGAWRGKIFNHDGRGINLFQRKTGEEQKYPFAYYISKSLRDKKREVIVLDYNQPGNPWWLRYIRDEMVATGDTTYLGKVNVYIAPHFHLSLGYFTLELP